MYAMSLMGLLVAGLIALGAALGLFSGPDSASAARLTAEGYVLTRSASLGALHDAAIRSQDAALAGLPVLTDAASASGGVCLAPWTTDTVCDISLTSGEMQPFIPPGWHVPTLGDGSPRWLVRMEGGVAYVYGPADAQEMAAIRKILRYPAGVAWCPPRSTNGDDCTPKLALPLPPDVTSGDVSYVVSAVELPL